MNIRKISHIGIAVQNWDQNISFYREVLGLELMEIKDHPAEGVRVALFKVGEVMLELLSPLSPDSPVAHFLTTRGEGLHHLAFAVDDLSLALKELKNKGVRLTETEAKRGVAGKLISFIHPRAAGGVLTELCE